MPKTDATFDPNQYTPVADRISLFFDVFPRGRIVTRLVKRTPTEVIFKAAVYRDADSRKPAATGWASEREGDGEVNTVACLENTETSAVGRALANLGFTASAYRPSREERQKAARARNRVSRRALHAHADIATDVIRLITRAERLGLRQNRAERWKSTVASGQIDAPTLERFERRLRAWISRRAGGHVSRLGIS
jgi:hypothetical protein